MSETNLSIFDKAIAIIHNTQDGNLLCPTHLKLTEMAVNGFLNDRGIEAFNKLYEEVISGKYKQPFLHGVELMTQDHEGYILFKGKAVEHYSSPWIHSLDARNSLLKIQQQCLFLESKGIAPDSMNIVWRWKDDNEFGEYQKAKLDDLMTADNSKIVFSEIVFAVDNDYLSRNKEGVFTNWGQQAAAKWCGKYGEKGYECAVHRPHLKDFNKDLTEMR